MTSTSQNQTSSLTSYLRRARSNCRTIMLCCQNKKFCKFHNATSHSTNECRIFWQHIQRAIQQGRLKFDTPRKMKVDDNPFPGDQNMVGVGLFKGKTHVLTSTKSREAGIVDPKMQISVDEYREIRNVVISKRTNTNKGKRQKMERQSCELHLGSC